MNIYNRIFSAYKGKTPDEVEKEVIRGIDIPGENGGYIAAAHAIQPDTPEENALAMFRATREYRY